jgi:hypothetical protein
MRKIRLLLAIMVATFWANSAKAQNVNTLFQDEATQLTSSALPTGWSIQAAASALYSVNASATITANSILSSASGVSGGRGYQLNFPASNTYTNSTGIVTLEADWVVTTRTVGSKNALGFMVDASASTTGTPVHIFGLYNTGSGAYLYLTNYRSDSIPFSGTGAFNFASASATASVVDGAGYNLVNRVYTTDAKTTSFAFAAGKTYHITAILNFNTKKLTSITISGNSNTATLTNGGVGFNFFDQTASNNNISKISLCNSRGTSKYGNGATVTFNTTLQNLQIYKTNSLGTLSTNGAQCVSTGVTLSTTAASATGETLYWQDTNTGTSTSYQDTRNVTTSGNNYLRMYTTNTTPAYNVWSVASSALAATVNPLSVSGTATATSPALYTGNGTTITLAGYTGTIHWEQSADGSTGWANVTGGSGETTATYTTPTLTTGTYYYRAIVTSGVCSTSTSNTATVTVTEPLSAAAVTVGSWTSGTGSFAPQAISTTSGEQSFTVSGTDLDGDIVLAPPAGFEVSLTSGSGFVNSTSSISITPTTKTVGVTTIYVRFVPGSILTTSGNITINSLNTIQQTKAVSGIGVASEPTVQASAATASGLLSRSMSLSWTTGDGSKHLVLYSTNSDVATAHLPVNGTTYTVGGTTAAGYIVGYVGTAISATISSLSPNTLYYYAIFDYNDNSTSGAESYLSTSPATTSAITVQTSATDGYFRSKATGDWSGINTWESSADNSSWHIADLEPIAAASALVTSPYTVTITTAITANTISMGDGAKLKMQTGAQFTKPIVGSGAITLEAASNNYYTQAVTGASTVNIILDNAGSTNSTWSDYWGGSFPSGTQINVTTGIAAAGFGVVGGLLTNNKVDLGAGVRLMHWYNQSVSGGGTSTIYVGGVSGNATSTIEGGTVNSNIRHLAYEIGAAGGDLTFDGVIKNYNGAATTAQLKIYKKGTGTWTLTGTSPFTPGLFNVDAGTVVMNGNLTATDVPVTVASGATLSGIGTINGATTVSGTLNGSLTFGSSVTLNPGAKMTVGIGNTMTIPTLNLNSDATGTATFVNNGTATVTTANVQQYLTSGRNWYVSSPVSAAPYTALSTATKVYKYDEPSAQFVEVTTGTLSPLVGYISQTTTTSSAITLSGTLNDGVQTVTLPRTYGVTKSGFNLVGNPYASYVSWDAAEKTNLEPTMWYRSMNAGATSYVFDTYNATSSIGTSNNGEVVNTNIPPMQAFWVRVKPAVLANDTTGTLTFRNSMRSHKGASDLKLKSRAVADATQQVLRLQVSNGTNSDEAVVYFNPNASDGLDDYDSPKMSNANAAIPEIYTVAGTEKLVINGLSVVTPEESLPLGFTTGQSNSFSIKATQIANFDGMKVYLRDNVLNTEQELTDASSYSFTSDVATTTTRFSVVFKSAGVTTGINAATDQAVVINKNGNNQITVICKGAINSDSFVSVYNALGQKVSTQQITANNTIISSSFRPGVYVVTVNNGNKTTTKKVILN